MTSDRWQFNNWEDALEHYFQEGLTDGLPVVPPTPERVQALLEFCGLAPDDLLGVEGIRRKQFPAVKVAVNAVMAGCLPEHFPVVVAAVAAVCDRTYNFHASSTSTNGIANLVLVSGPYASRVGMNHGVNLFGNGNRANAAIGRAINLIKANFYGSVSQEMDKSSLGHPGKYSFCFAEDLETSPWESLAESKGFHPGDASTVTTGCGQCSVCNWRPTGTGNRKGFLTAAAHAMLGLGPRLSELVLVISQELMAYVASSGWTRDQVAQFLYEKTQHPAGEWAEWRRTDRLPPGADRDRLIGCVASPDRIAVVPAGGDAGEFMAIISSWGSSRSVTREITVPSQEEGRV